MKKSVYKLASISLASALIFNTVSITMEASAKEKIKTAKKSTTAIKKNKLVDKKTGKVIKGFVTVDGKVYKDGKLYAGTVNGIKYAAGKKASTTINGIKYVAGKKASTTINGIKYVAGKKASTTINGIKYVAGKKVTGLVNGKLFVNGKTNKGDYYFNGEWYKGTAKDKEKNDAIKEYENTINSLKESDYTAEEWAKIKAALAENKLKANDKKLSLDQLTAALTAITTVVSKVKAEGKEKVEETNSTYYPSVVNNTNDDSNEEDEMVIDISPELAKIIAGDHDGIELTVADYEAAGLKNVNEKYLVDIKEGFYNAYVIKNSVVAQNIVDFAILWSSKEEYRSLVEQLSNGYDGIDLTQLETEKVDVNNDSLTNDELVVYINQLKSRINAKKEYNTAVNLYERIVSVESREILSEQEVANYTTQQIQAKTLEIYNEFAAKKLEKINSLSTVDENDAQITAELERISDKFFSLTPEDKLFVSTIVITNKPKDGYLNIAELVNMVEDLSELKKMESQKIVNDYFSSVRGEDFSQGVLLLSNLIFDRLSDLKTDYEFEMEKVSENKQDNTENWHITFINKKLNDVKITIPITECDKDKQAQEILTGKEIEVKSEKMQNKEAILAAVKNLNNVHNTLIDSLEEDDIEVNGDRVNVYLYKEYKNWKDIIVTPELVVTLTLKASVNQ